MKINPGHECVRSMTECLYYGCQKLRCIIRIKMYNKDLYSYINCVTFSSKTLK